MRKKQKSHIPETLRDLLPLAVSNANVLELATIRRWWLQRFDHPLRAQAVPYAVEKRRAIIHVSSSTWLQELHYLKPQILQEIRAKFPQTTISEIVLRIGPLPETPAVDNSATATAVPPKVQMPMTEDFARALSRIHDDELRAVVANVTAPDPTKDKKDS